MKTFSVPLLAALVLSLAVAHGTAQDTLPNTFSFTLLGDFDSPVPDVGSGPILIDNDLTDGYLGGFDLTDVPSGLGPSGPSGAAAVQWGTPLPFSSYAVPSALWFTPPTPPIHVVAEQPFLAGSLYFRNGIPQPGSGLTGLTLLLTSPDSPGTIAPYSLSVLDEIPPGGSFLATTAAVQLENLFAPIPYIDASGDPYFAEIMLAEDPDFGDGSLSLDNRFRVAEGTVGRADIFARFTTSPIPEPSSLRSERWLCYNAFAVACGIRSLALEQARSVCKT